MLINNFFLNNLPFLYRIVIRLCDTFHQIGNYRLRQYERSYKKFVKGNNQH